jgi:hypothetical protein
MSLPLLLLLFCCCRAPAVMAQAADPAIMPCDSCTDPHAQQHWWTGIGLNCPTGGDAGDCDICASKGNTAEATAACTQADSAEECCALCMQWNSGRLPGGHKPGNSMKCHSWFYRKNDKWCGLKNCDCPGKCGSAALDDNFVSGTACVSTGSKWGWPILQLFASITALYAIGGVLYMTRVKGKAFRIPDAIPHLDQWVALGGLCQDGIDLVAHSLGLRKGAARQRGGHGAPLLNGDQRQESKSKHKSKSKKKTKEKRHTNLQANELSGSNARAGSSGSTRTGPSAASPTAGGVLTETANSTASAAGGRWVKVDR